MKTFLLALGLTTLFGCYSRTESYDESRELIPNPEGYQKDTFVLPAGDTTSVRDTIHNKTPA
ncbi:hypothetical protein [Chitinophaga nivalis]|uniref:Uncharacterized protein n=1 Tax=Chitinophaga nivalis TaxID=2991709 RepID=A0ABT3IMX4_9BACT|nr:hypothetical protein [Chitinophaga nivalis]MCW3465015.1 hypothetical protein [Chitinophaga nivalis]MCW3485293.1 hypothetical protein [Chitinophaga nivalis]